MWSILGRILFTFFVFAAGIHLLMFNVYIWTFLFYILSELTDHRSVGLRPVEDDPNLHPNPNPRYRSVKLCTPTTHRTPMSSASTPTMSSTSSKRVSLGSKRRLFVLFVNLKRRAVLLCLFRCVRLVDGPPSWKAGTLPQQLRDQNLAESQQREGEEEEEGLEEGLERGHWACQTERSWYSEIPLHPSSLGGIWVTSSDWGSAFKTDPGEHFSFSLCSSFEFWTKLFIAFKASCLFHTDVHTLLRIWVHAFWSIGLIPGTRLWFYSYF